jgi:hypothetical protein
LGEEEGWSHRGDCPSSSGKAQGYALRLPQQMVCRRRTGSPAAVAAHKCFATLALVLPFARRRMYQYRVGRRRGAGCSKMCKRDRTSRGQITRRHDRRRVFAGLVVAPVFLPEGNRVTARLSFETPAELSLAVLERLTLRAVYHSPQHHGVPAQRSECHTTPAKMHLSTNFVGARHNAVRLRRAQAFLLKRYACLIRRATRSDSSQQTTNRGRAETLLRTQLQHTYRGSVATTTMHKCSTRAEGAGSSASRARVRQ